jgi:hypothetical protein
MVNTKFIGRLGNSMFQIAACIGYAKKYGYQWGVPSDQRESSILTHFPNLPRCNDSNQRYNEHQKQWDNEWFNYHEIPNVGPDVTLFGFFQSLKYFENAHQEVKEVFKLKHYPEYEGYISVHVRRGDYVNNSGSFPPVTTHYIGQAIQTLKKLLPFSGDVLFISDDIEWCKEEVQYIKLNYGLGFKPEFSEDCNEYEDLSKMASCSHHIIANSTFSWWGAYLGHNPNKIIVSPSCVRGNWFGMESGVKHDCVDLIPSDWIQIKFR